MLEIPEQLKRLLASNILNIDPQPHLEFEISNSVFILARCWGQMIL
jgi:hypothetical protein